MAYETELSIDSQRVDIIRNIILYYKKGWEEYDKETLEEHLDDLSVPLKKSQKNKLTKVQLINILLEEDKINLNEKSSGDLLQELKDFQTITY